MAHPTAIDLCNMMRAFAKRPASHVEMKLIAHCLASMFGRPSALGEEAKDNIVDLFDEIFGQIEHDEVSQLAEVTA